MKVYVITNGCYSDYHICAVTLDLDQANILVKRFSTSYDTAEIETFDTDSNELIIKNANVFVCWDNLVTSKIHIEKRNFDYFSATDLEVVYSGKKEQLFTYVLADTEEDALKKASDKFAKFRAEQIGL